MIQTYPNYFDQTQIIGLTGILNYHGTEIEIPFPLSIAISKATEYGIAISKATEYGIAISKARGG